MKKKIMKKLVVIACCLALAFGSSIKNVHAAFVIDDLAAIGLVTALAFATGITIKCATDDEFKSAVTTLATSAFTTMGAGIKSACYEAGAAGKWSVSKLNAIKSNIGNWWNGIYNTLINPPSYVNDGFSQLSIDYAYMSSNVGAAMLAKYSFLSSKNWSGTYLAAFHKSSSSYPKDGISNKVDPVAGVVVYSFTGGVIYCYSDMAMKHQVSYIQPNNWVVGGFYSNNDHFLVLSTDVNWFISKDNLKSIFNITVDYSGIFYSCATHAWYTGLDMTTKLKDVVLGQHLGDIDIADEGYKVPNSIDNVKPDSYTLTGPDATYDTTTHERYFPGTLDLPDTLTRNYPDTLEYPYVTDIPDDVTVPDTYNPTDVQTKDPEPTYVDPKSDDKYKIDWHDVFPLCIPWDLVAMMKALNADPVAPNFTWNYDLVGNKGKLKIDLAQFDEIAVILRTMELLAFAVGLAFATRYLIKG